MYTEINEYYIFYRLLFLGIPPKSKVFEQAILKVVGYQYKFEADKLLLAVNFLIQQHFQKVWYLWFWFCRLIVPIFPIHLV